MVDLGKLYEKYPNKVMIVWISLIGVGAALGGLVAEVTHLDSYMNSLGNKVYGIIYGKPETRQEAPAQPGKKTEKQQAVPDTLKSRDTTSEMQGKEKDSALKPVKQDKKLATVTTVHRERIFFNGSGGMDTSRYNQFRPRSNLARV